MASTQPDPEERFGRRRRGRNAPEWRFVYFIEAEGLHLVKIGCADDPRRRLAELQTGSPAPLLLRGVIKVDDAARLERMYHQTHAHLRTHGEWFRIDDRLRELIDDLDPPETVFGCIMFDADRHTRGQVEVRWLPERHAVVLRGPRVQDLWSALPRRDGWIGP